MFEFLKRPLAAPKIKADPIPEKPPTQVASPVGIKDDRIHGDSSPLPIGMVNRLARHQPFQQWAIAKTNADPFAGPIAVATNLLVRDGLRALDEFQLDGNALPEGVK